MTYFISADQQVLTYDFNSAHDRFLQLHETLSDEIRKRDWDLHPHWKKSRIITNTSAASNQEANNAVVLSYFRPMEQARLVENLMGIESSSGNHEVLPARHPVIELRLTPDHFAIELILSPYAWWDQQNFMGKFDIERHRHNLRQQLSRMGDDYRFGFWEGTHLGDMHLTGWQLMQGRIMNEWVSTFADGQDWLRFGMWYDPDCARLSADCIIDEAVARIGELYTLYDFLLWTSNNNYHDFYMKRNKRSRRMYA